MEISVIIPTKDRIKQLEKTLLEYNSQTVKDFEMVVIVDGAKDNTRDMLRGVLNKVNYPLRYYVYKNNGGTARARNKGVEMARGKYVLFTGDDCYPDKRLIEEHLKTLTQNNGSLGFIKWYDPNEFMRWISPNGAQFRYNWIRNPNRVNWYIFYTANIAYPKKWSEYEKFDEENFKDAAAEDTELGYRFMRRGFRIVLNKNAVVYHDHNYNLEGFIKRTERVGYYTWIMINKYKRLKDKKAVFKITMRHMPFVYVPFGSYLFKYTALILSKLTKPIAKKPYWFFTLCYHLALGFQAGEKTTNKNKSL